MIEIKNKTDSTIQLHTHEFSPSEKIEIGPTWYIDEVIDALVNQDFVILRNGEEVNRISLQIDLLKGELKEVRIFDSIKQVPFADKNYQGKRLFRRLHGEIFDLDEGINELIFVCPYLHAKITGVQFINSEALDTGNFEVLDSIDGDYTTVPNLKLNQFGFDVVMRQGDHEHACKYDADIYQGMQIKITYDSKSEKQIGINYFMDEVKE